MLTAVFGFAPFQIVGAVVKSVTVFMVNDGIAVRVVYERLCYNPVNAFHLPQVADGNLDVMVSVENYGLDYRLFAFEIPFDVSEVRHVERHACFRLGEFYECFFISFHIKKIYLNYTKLLRESLGLCLSKVVLGLFWTTVYFIIIISLFFSRKQFFA